MVQAGGIDKWGHFVEVVENKTMVGIGFHPALFKGDAKAIQSIFHS